MLLVRTTVTLDPDSERIVRDRMEAHGVGFKRALNDVIRAGVAREHRTEFRTPTFDLGQPAIDLTHALRLAADLEDEAVAERMRADG